MIIEIAGRPAEHVKEALKTHIGQLKSSKTVKLISENYSEPKRIEAEQEIYTCFAEVEIETVRFLDMVNLIFDFMPSSFELISPEEIDFNLTDATSMLNTLSGRLHKYDEIAKVAQFQVQQLAYKMNQMQQAATPKQVQEIKEKKSKKKGKKK
jgi:hypothetical protein